LYAAGRRRFTSPQPPLSLTTFAAAASELARFTGHKQLIWSVAFAPDAKQQAATASADQTIRLWKLH